MQQGLLARISRSSVMEVRCHRTDSQYIMLISQFKSQNSITPSASSQKAPMRNTTTSSVVCKETLHADSLTTRPPISGRVNSSSPVSQTHPRSTTAVSACAPEQGSALLSRRACSRRIGILSGSAVTKKKPSDRRFQA